jgi:hypothetical protein
MLTREPIASEKETKMYCNFMKRHTSIYERKRKKVRIGDREFPSMTAAANHLGIQVGNMSNLVKRGRLSDGTPIARVLN